MASITDKKAIFFVTSPRTPDKLFDEIRFLVENFKGQPWNADTQKNFYLALAEQDFFEGSAGGDVAFKARDRINRAPKAIGLVDLSPSIQLTDAGEQYLYGARAEEVFLKQLLKFQLHSPYHTDNNDLFNVKPYLELIRLINEMNGLSKVEIALFVMQLTDYRKYDEIKRKITKFRTDIKEMRKRKISYNTFVLNSFEAELRQLFSSEIAANEIETRESKTKTVSEFIGKKRRNHMDYADASIRYLRATGLFSIDPFRNKIYVSKDKQEDVDFICSNVERSIYAYTDDQDYKNYLFDPNNIKLLTDDEEKLIDKIRTINPVIADSLQGQELSTIKDAYDELQQAKLDEITGKEIEKLQSYEGYNEVVDIYDKINGKEITEPPLFFEWNTWRAFTMLDDGNIKGNFKVDDDGLPLYTAPGNKADIECQYHNFDMIVEVTMSSGHKQYEMEGEPVARHLGNAKRATEKDVYCIFIAPTISPSTLAHYFILHKTPIATYGGKSKIIPLELNTFRTMLDNAYRAKAKPTAADMKQFLDRAVEHAEKARDEIEWQEKINMEALTAFV